MSAATLATASMAEEPPAAASGITSFLTEAQRSALDAALATKAAEAKQAALQQHSAQHKGRNATGDRKQRAGRTVTGGPKKGGAGGKFTWGGLMAAQSGAEAALDVHDPNYDSEEERAVMYQSKRERLKAEVEEYKAAVQGVIEEYFSSGDVHTVIAELEDQGHFDFGHYFVKKLLTMAMDRNGREREMASALLSSVYGEVISSDQMSKGFLRLVAALDDLALDVPDVVELAATFISRAVVDDVLPPSIAQRIDGPPGSLAAEVRHKVEMNSGARHAAERLLRCWGAGAVASHAEVKGHIATLLSEYQASRDVGEARRCLHSLAVPFFHHELVKQAVNIAMEEPGSKDAILPLLSAMSESGEVTSSQMQKGFQRVIDNLAQTALDVPAAPAAFRDLLAAARSAGLVDDSLQAPSDEQLKAAAAGEPAGPAQQSLQAYKAGVLSALREYFDSADAGEAGRRLAELGEPGLRYTAVKHAVALALDRGERERELVSELMVELCPAVVSHDQVAAGFERLLESADDLVLDCPDAVHLLALFTGRAIVDEVLAPSFLVSVLPTLRPDGLGVAVVRSTGAMLHARHAAEALQNCWHGGGLTLDQIKAQIKALLQEYLSSADLSEAERLLRGLAVPHYHHELVKEALEVAFENPGSQASVVGLLAKLADTGDISATQMAKGFSRIASRLDDLVLDYPSARKQFDEISAAGKAQSWLQDS